MPLTLANSGEIQRIKHIGGSNEIKKHLGALGFTVGEEISVISQNTGNVIVSVKDTRIAISKEMANRIMV